MTMTTRFQFCKRTSSRKKACFFGACKVLNFFFFFYRSMLAYRRREISHSFRGLRDRGNPRSDGDEVKTDRSCGTYFRSRWSQLGSAISTQISCGRGEKKYSLYPAEFVLRYGWLSVAAHQHRPAYFHSQFHFFRCISVAQYRVALILCEVSKEKPLTS